MNRFGFLIGCFCALALGCGQEKKPAPGHSSVQTPTPTTAPAPQAASPAAAEPTPAPAANASPQAGIQAPAAQNLPAPSAKRPPGSVAYVTQEGAALWDNPTESARKLPVRFKRSETIYVLEPKMTDENGKEYDIPQWYKIQCENGQQGWMRARFVGLPF